MATVFYGGAFTGKVSTSSGSLNVRDTASTSAPIVNTLPRNSLKTFGSNYMTDYGTYAREWLLHYQNGPNTTPEGYVSSKYITWLPSYGDGACFRTNVVVTPGQYVNLRQSPSTSSTSIHRLHKPKSIWQFLYFSILYAWNA